MAFTAVLLLALGISITAWAGLSGFGLYGRPPFVSAKGGKTIAPGWAASRFPHSGAAPPGRAEGPSMALRRWLGVLPRSPAPRRLHSACAQVAIGGVCEVCVEEQEQKQEQCFAFSTIVQTPPNATLAQAEWRRCAGGDEAGAESALRPGGPLQRVPPEQRRREGTPQGPSPEQWLWLLWPKPK
jgi:hypothetical protein